MIESCEYTARNMSNKQKPLMICYYYPPLADVGCNRSVAFARYLKTHGWLPSVISVRNPDRAYCRLGNAAAPENIPVHYTRSIINLTFILGKLNGALAKSLKVFGITTTRNRLYNVFCIPDCFWGWIPVTTVKAVRLARNEGSDFIYVSCTPFSSAMIGILVKRMTSKPLVIDFRDPFALDDLSFLGFSPWRMKLNKLIERYIMKHADLFIVTTEETRTKYIEQYPFVRDKIFTVYNGFDSAMLPGSKPKKFEKFTIVYTGDFYFWAPQDNELFFKALAMLKTEGRINRNTFQFLFYGDAREEITSLARKYSIEDIVVYNQRVPYQEALEILSRSHLQLLRIAKLMISTKFFEGIPLNTPFLATIPPGEVEQLIRKYSPSSSIITDESVEKVADAIMNSIAQYKLGMIRDNLVEDFLRTFSRENQTRRLMELVSDHLLH